MRDPLVDTANPWNSPAATLAAPRPIISWSGLTSSPRRAAKLVDVAIVSVSDTSVMPSGRDQQRPDVAQLGPGDARPGQPLRQRTDRLDPVRGEVEDGRDDGRADDRDEDRRQLPGEAGQDEQHGQRAEPDGQGGRVRLVEVLHERS